MFYLQYMKSQKLYIPFCKILWFYSHQLFVVWTLSHDFAVKTLLASVYGHFVGLPAVPIILSLISFKFTSTPLNHPIWKPKQPPLPAHNKPFMMHFSIGRRALISFRYKGILIIQSANNTVNELSRDRFLNSYFHTGCPRKIAFWQFLNGPSVYWRHCRADKRIRKSDYVAEFSGEN